MLRFIRKTLYVLFQILTRPVFKGVENIPAKGACILATNHLSVLDAPLILCVQERDDFTALIARKHKKNIAFRFLVDTVKGIWIDRYLLEVQPLKEIISHLKKGGLLGVSPEGTRSLTHQLIKAKEGVAYLAAKTNTPIVPVAVTGTEDASMKIVLLQRPKVKVEFGKPFHLPPLDQDNRNGALEKATDEIMCRIASMLPQKYWGVYSSHPRLKELIQEGATPA
jgi:1-acyl-sn-glycerol-3-phosphate acyltransferase